MIPKYLHVDINELCYKIDNGEDQRLLANFHYSDTGKKQTILNIAELEARRSRFECDEITGQQENEGKKLNFTEFTAKHKADQSEQEEDNELKPFA